MAKKNTGTKADWFLVINDMDRVLGVYGAALEDDARALAAKLLQELKFGVRLVKARMMRPGIGAEVPHKAVTEEVLLYLEGQDPKSPIHPNTLGTLRERGGTWAAYRNEAMDHSQFSQHKYLKFGEGCGYPTPPLPRLPDTDREINWPYRYAGTVDVTTGLITK